MTKLTTHRYIAIATIVAIIAAIGAVAFFSPRSSAPAQTGSTTSRPDSDLSPSTGSDQTTDTNSKKTYPVSVYFSKHPQSDDDPGATFPVARVSVDAGVGRFAISELLKQPTTAESSQGYFTTARLHSGTSTCGGENFSLTISSGIATLQFCKPFDHLGVVADGQADSELKATLKQFSTVKKVVILNSKGDCEFDLSGQNLCKQ
mgnify:CR=1 FL=1